MSRRSFRVRFEGGSGFNLAGIVDEDQDHPDAPVIVFSHCFTCNKDLKAIVRISRGLASAGFKVLRFDMTGLGGSEGNFSDTSFSTNLMDLRAASKFAHENLGEVRGLIGHSFGGAASLMTAAQATDQPLFQSLGWIATIAAPSDTQHLAHLLSRMNPKIVEDGEGEVTIGGRSWRITSAMLDDFLSHSLLDHISQIQVPTLAFHSPVDATVQFDHAIRIQTLINAAPELEPRCSLITMPQADHLLADNPADIELVTTTIAGFARRYS